MVKQKRYSKEVKERTVKMVFDHQSEYGSEWACLVSIASKIGCTPETLRSWVRKSQYEKGDKTGHSSTDQKRVKELERENRELKKVNEILRKAAAFFAQADLDRRPK